MGIVTLLTDFGTEDGYVGAVKGRILSLAPEVNILDISHQIPKYNIRHGAFCLNTYVKYFPEGTVHVAVIDPGVGGTRYPIVIKTDEFYVVCPDNGIASYILESFECEIYLIKTDWITWKISDTFHGRDIFAPTAANIAMGEPLSDYTIPFEEKPVSFFIPVKQLQANKWELSIQHIDHFGNIITNLHIKDVVSTVGDINKARVQIGKVFLYGIKKSYSAVNKGACMLIWDSSGYLAIAQNSGNAAQFFNMNERDKLLFEY